MSGSVSCHGRSLGTMGKCNVSVLSWQITWNYGGYVMSGSVSCHGRSLGTMGGCKVRVSVL